VRVVADSAAPARPRRHREVRRVLLEVVAEKTGYRRDARLGMALDADSA